MKTIVITGASKGIGKELAKKLSSKNINLILGARSLEKLEELQLENTHYIKLDLTSEESITNFFTEIKEKFNNIDILINNAGIGYNALIKDTNITKAKELFDINFFGLVACSKEALNGLMNKDGKIVNIASQVAFRGLPEISMYCASKAAVKSFSESLNVEAHKQGIKVIVIYPEKINTGFHKTTNNNSKLEKPIIDGKMNTSEIADYIIEKIKQGKFENIPILSGSLLKYINVHYPKILDKKFSKRLT